ncbi:extracellular solute-binding protein [Jeotgalibacillus soli]|uniref:ABC transporter substrate-binding protein n=1 Tax=Jeotgalibacillus soli TaxID=889306 RepID=A0A0C2S737_9BACL|nr:extracellular solute-binding protein [Jeotgalibacillus soli]KIL49844.1 hypothetical protein KP78_13120 [Jeotgalibacillus soli]
MKKVGMLFASILLLAGCNAPWASDSSGETGTENKDDQVTIEVMMFEGGFGSEWVKSSADAYMEQNENVSVEVIASPDIHQQLQTRFLSNDVPDLMVPGPSFDIMGVINDGKILGLDDYLEEDSYSGEEKWLDTFEQGQFNLKRDGKTLGIPTVFSSGYVWWYNEALFEENGWETPETWQDLYVLKDQAAEKEIPLFAVPGMHPGYYFNGIFIPLVERIGGKQAVLDAFNLKEGAWTSEAFAEAARESQKMVEEGLFLEGTFGLSHTEAQTLFFQNQALFATAGTWLEGEMSDIIPEDFKLRAMNQPIWEGSDAEFLAPVSTGWGGAWYVTEDSENKEETVQFLKFLSSSEEVKKMVESRGLASVVKNTEDAISSDALKSALTVMQEAEGSYAPTAINDSYPEMTNNMINIYQSLMLNEITPEEFTQRAEEFAAQVRDDSSIQKMEFSW